MRQRNRKSWRQLQKPHKNPVEPPLTMEPIAVLIPPDAPKDSRLTTEPRESSREALRPPLREDHLARAEARMAELDGHLDNIGDASDRFYVNPDIIPDGWAYNWKRVAIVGKPDPSYEMATARQGWESVPAQRHSELMPHGYMGDTIDIEGLRLMERPKQIDDMRRTQDQRDAKNQIRIKEQQLGNAPPGTLQREDAKGRSQVRLNKSYENIPIPKD